MMMRVIIAAREKSLWPHVMCYLRSCGCAVTRVDSLLALRRRLERKSFHVAVLTEDDNPKDVTMRELIPEIRARYKGMAIVLIVPGEMKGIEWFDLHHRGADTVATLPLNAQALLESIRAAFSRRGFQLVGFTVQWEPSQLPIWIDCLALGSRFSYIHWPSSA